ncbi:MAG TPA: hypothetical protein VKR54_04620 [Candidatus Babeliales bacterium]|jgi:hypothetical protein|nr:hypothetical protein [Candidatus Babeliales bacterium]
MKKISVLLLLSVAHIALTSCMIKFPYDEQPYHTQTSKGKPLLFSYSAQYNLPQNDCNSIPLQPITPQQPNHICTANQPGWEKLNDIVYAPYTSDQPIAHNPTDKLRPIYIPITTLPQKSITKQKEEPLPRTIVPKQPDNDLMQKLYNSTYNFIDTKIFSQKHIAQHVQDQYLTLLILDINKARINGINEDVMGQFAHKQDDHITSLIGTTLFFSLLKRYTLTVNETKEPLPFGFEKPYIYENNLIEIFNNSSHPNNTYKSDTNDICFQMNKYPAFIRLYRMLHHAFQTCGSESLDLCGTYLYADQTIVTQNCAQGFYTDLKNEFYSKAYDMFFKGTSLPEGIYDLLQIIKTAKNKHDIQNEAELGYDILTFKPTNAIAITNTMYQMYNYNDEKYAPHNAKKRISLFCKLVEKYNHARTTKKIPTDKQYIVYKMIHTLDLALPDVFNNELLDDNQYAFTEWEQLERSTKALEYADDQQIQQCVDQLYPQKK